MFLWGLCNLTPQTPVPTAHTGQTPTSNWCEHTSVYLVGTKPDICAHVLAIGPESACDLNMLLVSVCTAFINDDLQGRWHHLDFLSGAQRAELHLQIHTDPQKIRIIAWIGGLCGRRSQMLWLAHIVAPQGQNKVLDAAIKKNTFSMQSFYSSSQDVRSPSAGRKPKHLRDSRKQC